MSRSTSRRRLAVSAVATCAALVVGACGGTKQATPTTAAPSPEASTTTPVTTVAPTTAAPTTAAPATTVFTPDESIQETVKDLIDQGLPAGSASFAAYAQPFASVLEQLAGPGPVTLLLPTNQAWSTFLSVTGLEEQATFEDQALMSKILSYLVVTSGRYTDEDLVNMDGQELTTTGGHTLKVTSRFGQAFLPGFNGITSERTSGLTAVTGGLPARNGYIHLIDFVPLPADELLPLMKCPTGKYGCLDPKGVDPGNVGYCMPENTNEACVPLTDVPATSVPTTTSAPATTVLPDLAVMESAWEQATWPGQPFGWFVEAIKAAGLESVLQGPGPVTIFIPPDPTFKALFDVLGIKKQDVFGNKELLTKIISYLVVTGTNRYTAEDLLQMTGQELTTIGGAKLRVTAKYGRIFLPGTNPFPDISEGGALSLVYGSIRARNGFVHIIDWVPLPPGVNVRQLLKCPSAPFGCVKLSPEKVGFSHPGFCVETKPLYGCLALPEE